MVKKKKKKRKLSILSQLPQAIVYLSDAFVFLIVLTWIFYIVNAVFGAWFELICTGNTTIFTDLKDACTIPLTGGGIVWLIRTAANHLAAGWKGHRLSFDFPNIDDDGNVIDHYVDHHYGNDEGPIEDTPVPEDNSVDEEINTEDNKDNEDKPELENDFEPTTNWEEN